MYTANYTVGATSTSVRDAINATVSGEVRTIAAQDGRCFQITVIASAATVLVGGRAGTLAANEGAPLPANVPVTFQSPTGNQLSMDEIYLSGVGTVSIMVLVL